MVSVDVKKKIRPLSSRMALKTQSGLFCEEVVVASYLDGH